MPRHCLELRHDELAAMARVNLEAVQHHLSDCQYSLAAAAAHRAELLLHLAAAAPSLAVVLDDDS